MKTFGNNNSAGFIIQMRLSLKDFSLMAVILGAMTLSGCVTYRTNSNIASKPASAVSSKGNVLVLEGVPDKKYKELGPVEVTVKKLTVFDKDPTKEQANQALIEKARIIGADAVVKVAYKNGIGLTTWGYINAKGTGIKFSE